MSGNLHSSLTVQSNKDSKNIPINQITALSMCTLYKYLMIWKTPSWLVGRKYYSWHDSIQDGMSLHASVLQIFFFFLKECNKYLILKGLWNESLNRYGKAHWIILPISQNNYLSPQIIDHKKYYNIWRLEIQVPNNVREKKYAKKISI